MTKRKRSIELLPVGRKRSVDEDVTRKLEESLAWDCTVLEACAYAGISDTTYYEERQRDPVFAEKMDRAQQFAFVLAKKVVLQSVDRGDGALALKWLDRRQRDRYHTKVEQDVKQVPIEQILDAVEETTDYPVQFETAPPPAKETQAK